MEVYYLSGKVKSQVGLVLKTFITPLISIGVVVNGYSWSPKQGIVQVEIDGVDGRRSVTYIKPKPGLNYPYYFRTNYQGPADFWDIFHEISSDWNEYLGLKVLEPTRRDYIVLIDAQKHLRRIILPTIAN